MNGGWGAWSEWLECSVPCDGGTQSRSRTCNNPAPAHGGAVCEGEDTVTRACNSQTCVNNKYTIVQETGEDGGFSSGAYFFTVIGADGETGEYDCVADRSKGAVSECSFVDPVPIGSLKGVRIENKSGDAWVFISLSVKINDVLTGKWRGNGSVKDYKTLTIYFTYIFITLSIVLMLVLLLVVLIVSTILYNKYCAPVL